MPLRLPKIPRPRLRTARSVAAALLLGAAPAAVRAQGAPPAQRLEAVTISGRESTKRRKYFIDADAIMHSSRAVTNALDVITMLRPNMLTSIAGTHFCPIPLSYVWINGRRIRNVAPDAAVAARGTPSQPNVHVPPEVLTILSQIRPEHIEQMTYHDCMDMSVGKIGSENAVFIVLKPGVAYAPGRGSYVVGDTASRWHRER